MCGRYSLITSKEKLEKQFKVEVAGTIHPSYNIAPTQMAYIIANDKPLELQQMRWGLIPHWAKDKKTGYNLINARKEGITSKASFRLPVRKRRCLVLADSFYEWRRDGSRKQPFRIFLRDGNVLAFAGIYDIWYDRDDEKIMSFSIITTPPNKDMETIHNRMPAILPTAEMQWNWLEEKDLDTALTLLKPLEDGLLNNYKISTMVNSVRNNMPEIHKELPEQPLLFD